LPVSSSGHLVVANAVLESFGRAPTKDLVEVNIVLHVGTLVSILVFYRREIVRLATVNRRVVPLLVIGTIPAAIVGVSIKEFFPGVLERPMLAGLMFPLTAVLLVWSVRRPEGDGDFSRIGVRSALLVGMLQAVAILPGISRSGATIAAGLFCGLRRDSAATFAFLLAVPAIAGAGLLETISVFREGTTGTPIPNLVFGGAVAFVVGLGALRLLIRFVERGRLDWFAWYLVPLGAAVTIWQWLA